jgi:hypothetical protein
LEDFEAVASQNFVAEFDLCRKPRRLRGDERDEEDAQVLHAAKLANGLRPAKQFEASAFLDIRARFVRFAS